MGRILIKAINESDKCTLTGGCERPGSPELGKDLGTLAGLAPLGMEVTDDVGAVCKESDVVVDYSAASATMSLIPTAIEKQTPLMVATTGFTESQHTKLVEAGQSLPIILGANMSVSVMAMYELIKTAARLLDDEFDIEQIVGDEPTPQFAAQLSEETKRILDQAPTEKGRQMLVWMLEGHTDFEIAEKIGCARVTVWRTRNRIRARLEQESSS